MLRAVKLRFTLLLALAAGPLACDGCRKPDPPPPSARTTVTLEAGEVRIDGVAFAKRADLPRDPARVTPVFDELKARREAWRTAHSREEFPGVAELVLPADATCTEAMTLLYTLAMVAYAHVDVKQGSETLQVDYWIPTPPNFLELPDPDPPQPLQLRFRGGGNVAVSQTCTGAPDVIAASAVPARVEATRPYAPGFRVGCEPGVLFSDVRPTLSAIRKVRMMKLEDDGCASTRDGGAPMQVLAPNLGLGGGETLVHRPGKLGTTKVTSTGIDEALARKAIEPHLGAIAACFEDKRPARAAFILGNYDGDHRAIELVVASDGGIALAARGGASNELDLCLARQLVGLVFPAHDGGAVKLTYEFVFVDASP